jgi:hypothetical protein
MARGDHQGQPVVRLEIEHFVDGDEANVGSRGGIDPAQVALGGSTFRFTAWLEHAPVSTPDELRRSPASAAVGGAAERLIREHHGAKRVLLAEDNPINRFVAQELLQSAGLVVETASDGAVALQMAHSHA